MKNFDVIMEDFIEQIRLKMWALRKKNKLSTKVGTNVVLEDYPQDRYFCILEDNDKGKYTGFLKAVIDNWTIEFRFYNSPNDVLNVFEKLQQFFKQYKEFIKDFEFALEAKNTKKNIYRRFKDVSIFINFDTKSRSAT